LRFAILLALIPWNILHGFGQTVVVTNPASPWTVPAGVTSIKVEVWGGGGSGGGCNSTLFTSYGSGGGGGAYNVSTISVSSGQTYTITIGTGGTAGSDANGNPGTASSVSGSGGSVTANPGLSGARRGGTAGTGGTGGFNNGGNGGLATSNGAGGGGGAGNATPSGSGNGGNGSNNAAGSAGSGALPGGAGGANRTGNGAGNAGTAPGGGGGGGRQSLLNGAKAGGAGASGKVVITYTIVTGPTITGFSPGNSCSASGQSVIITGTNFSGATAVTFYSGRPASFTVNSPTQITATLPVGATTGPINVTSLSGTGTSSGSFTVNALPAAPTLGTITQPTCVILTGSVVLNGLPATGTWTLTRAPGGTTTTGTGTSTIIPVLPSGSYTFTVTNSAGCVSPPSANVIINAPPASPTPPVQRVDCSLGFDHAIVSVTSPTGANLEYSLDGGAYQISPIFNQVNNGSHYLSVRNTAGCTTGGTLFEVSCGCTNPPAVTMSSYNGRTCSTTSVTVTGNMFGGTATSVTITSNGTGTLNPSSAGTSPFSFTYTPSLADGDNSVIITVTTNNPLGTPCTAATGTYTLTVNAIPSAPSIGTITNLTCAVPTGSVVLNGLPSTGTWTLIRNPGAVITNGTGTITTVSGLTSGTYSFVVTSAEGCSSTSSADVVIAAPPSAPAAPVVGIITQPTCAISTGIVVLSGLPPTGSWTVTRNPGAVTVSGSGTATTINTIPPGTYTFTVTNSTGCTSPQSGNVLVNTQPPIPPAPSVGTITPPGCTLSTGSAVLTGLPSTGTWTLIRYPGTVSTSGSGTSSTITGLTSGTHNFTVMTANGCLSVPSANVVIPGQPPTPAAPEVGTITQPTFAEPTGSVVLNGLPSTGSWIITRLPGSLTIASSGTTSTITNLEESVFTFKVTNSSGCTSAESVPVTISKPGVPVLIITNPPAVCSPNTVDITNPSITQGSSPGLVYTYWKDSNATIVYSSPVTAAAGTYYIKGTTASGYFNIKPVTVTIDQLSVPKAGIDQTLAYIFTTTLDATIVNNETGFWSIISGTSDFSDKTDPKALISNLSEGDNILLWTVKRGVCPEVTDTVAIIVNNIIISTLITPNMDGRNDYFVIKGLTSLGKTELLIFDRRGVQVYRNPDYDNLWNGVDYNKKPLPDDTYFYVIKTANRKFLNGYAVIRR
jgi:gliding motility-associated-like protein